MMPGTGRGNQMETQTQYRDVKTAVATVFQNASLPEQAIFRKEGEYWTVGRRGKVFRLERDSLCSSGGSHPECRGRSSDSHRSSHETVRRIFTPFELSLVKWRKMAQPPVTDNQNSRTAGPSAARYCSGTIN